MTDVLINILLILFIIFLIVAIIPFVKIAKMVINEWREKKLEERCSSYEEALKHGYKEMGVKNEDSSKQTEKEIKGFRK